MIDEVKEIVRDEIKIVEKKCGITLEDDFLTYIATHVVEFKSKEIMSVDLMADSPLSEAEKSSVRDYM